MKVHSNKVKGDFSLYFDEFKRTVHKNLSDHENNYNLGIGYEHEIFVKMYPLFVFIESITSPGYLVDPSKEMELDQCIKDGNREKILQD